jgi:PAS domain S-box-containing protein
VPKPEPDPGGSVDLAAFARFSELTPDALVAVDAAGRIVMANRQVKPVFGYDRDELVGQPVDRLVPPSFRDHHGRHRAAYLTDPRTRPMGQGRLDLRGLRKDGLEFPAEISLSSIDTSNGLLAVAAIRDVSERRHAAQERADVEARLVRERALASRTESIGQLAGGVAHDFNNLLSVIIGNAVFLAGRLAPDTPEFEEVEEIRRASVQAAGLTRQLLRFSRRQDVEPVALDIHGVVRDVERLLRRTLGEHVELTVRLAPDLPPVLGDPDGIQESLIKLAVNARDALPDGGSLSIDTSEVELTDQDAVGHPGVAPGRYVRLSVIDGTGPGLAYVDLPIAAAGSLQRDGGIEAVHVDAGQHVLIAEDDDAVRRIAERMLRRCGYGVTSVSSGAMALEALAADTLRIDVLLTDVVMPGMTGVDLIQRAREIRPGLVVGLMSGDIDSLVDLAGDPASFVVQKPFTQASLTDALRAALARRSDRGGRQGRCQNS